MLSIGKLGCGQERYYLDKVAAGAEDYYAGEGEAQGYWLGEGAEVLGLDGKVEPNQLGAMLAGEDPATGEPLGLKSAPGREPVPGFDLTFSAPKSVSLTWALGGHPVSGQVAEAHRTAVREALAYLERHACWARRGRGGAEFVPGAGFIAAAYAHRSSRAGDPQLHTHVLVANATLGPDGRWSRLYHPALYEHAKTASYIYEAHLRHELTVRLGVEWEPVRKGIADISGFTAEQLRHFSTRRAEILEAAGEGASARAMQVATLATRATKERDLTTESLRELWRAKGREVGLDRDEIGLFLGHERPGQTILTAALVARSVTAHVSHFDRREAIQAVADNLPHGATATEVEELADAFLASDSVIRIAETPRGERFTTQRIWELERRALTTAGEMAADRERCLVHPIQVGRALDSHPSLKPDQRAMVERLLSGGSGLEVVIGEAGTGKTYATVAAAEGWAAAGNQLVVAAPTWRAAGVLRAEGIEARTVASLIGRLDSGEASGQDTLGPRSVLLVDEAGMVDSGTLARLIEHARAAEAKLVLIGDPAQLGEIEAGGLFAAITERTEPIRLTEVIRHNHEFDREAAKLIRAGRGTEAVERYAEEGRVHVSPDAVERREAILADWWQAKQEGSDALMLAKRNSERAALNERARELMRSEGRLGAEELWVGGQPFAVGDEVITRVNDQRAQVFNRERWRVEEVDLDSERLRLAGIDTPRQVGVDPSYLGRVNPSDGAPALEHAYATTIYQAQGSTVDSAFVMADPSLDRQEFYVAASRSREETFFYATPEIQAERSEIAPGEKASGLEHIARAAERDGSQAAAHDAALRERLGKLPTEELHSRRAELSSEAGSESHNQRAWEEVERRIAGRHEELVEVERQLRLLGPEPGLFGKRAERDAYCRQHSLLAEREQRARDAIVSLKGERDERAPVEHQARAELAVIEHVLAERLRERLAAVRLDPPDYIVKELGERPVDPRERAAWDRGVQEIEGFRAAHGVRDKENALGRERGSERSRDGAERSRQLAREATQRRLREQQCRLGRVQERVRDLDRGLSIGM